MSNRTNRWSAGMFIARTFPVLLVVLALPGVAVAQSTADTTSADGFELTGYLGAYTPLAKLADSGDSLRAEFSTKIAYGLELDYWFGSFGVGLNGNYARPNLTLQIVEEVGFPISLDLGATDVWMATLNLMWRPQLKGSASMVRPYFAVGPGVVSVMYPADREFDVEDETRFAVALAAGAQIEINSAWFARVDLRDYISQFNTEPFTESKTQHDLITSVGLGYAFH
jgi:opacity protein-like surface antigen